MGTHTDTQTTPTWGQIIVRRGQKHCRDLAFATVKPHSATSHVDILKFLNFELELIGGFWAAALIGAVVL